MPRPTPRAPAALAAASLALLASAAALPAAAIHDEGCVPVDDPTPTVELTDRTWSGWALVRGLAPLAKDGLYVDVRWSPYAERLVAPVYELWLYQESNGVPGLQRGGISILGPSYPPPPLPALLAGEDPRNDENCWHGADRFLAAFALPWVDPCGSWCT